MKNKKPLSIAFVSTYPPRQCGISTFTKDLTNALNTRFPKSIKTKIFAVDTYHTKSLSYPREVKFRINEIVLKDYIQAAKKINKNKSIDMVNIQHEYGLYGGKYLNYLTVFFETLKKPVVTTMHTVIPSPPESIKSTAQYIAKKSNYTVVLTKTAVDILEKDYSIPKNKIKVIPHGIHDVPYESSNIYKKKLGLKEVPIIMSFGLISKSKRFEDVIGSLPKVIRKYPNLQYIIVGKTHSNVLMKKRGVV